MVWLIRSTLVEILHKLLEDVKWPTCNQHLFLVWGISSKHFAVLQFSLVCLRSAVVVFVGLLLFSVFWSSRGRGS